MTRRIALVSEHASPLAVLGGVDSGGQNVYVGQLAKHLAAIGYEVDVLTRRDNELLPDKVEWVNGVHVIHVPAGPPSFVRKEELLPYMKEFTAYVLRLSKRRRRPYDLFHANFWMSGLVAADLRQALGIPFVITFHALGRVRRLHQGQADDFPDARFEVEDRVVAEADHIIAECPQDEEDLIRLYHADPNRVSIVPSGFDPTEFWPIDKALARVVLGIPPKERVLLQLGRMVPRKGVDNVIRGYARLLRDHKIAARLLIVGGEADQPDPETSPELRRLMDIAEQEGVSGGVSFLGRAGREALKNYYSAADIFITTPWYEPFGITPVESMACGTPVVGANVGGIKFSVRDGETGYLVPAKDPDALAERLAHLYRNPKLLSLFGRQGVRRATDLFTWEKVANSMADLYESVLVGGRPERKHEAERLSTIDRAFKASQDTLAQSRWRLRIPIMQAADTVADALVKGNKLLAAGNGGSAAAAQHLVGELLGRYRAPDRAALPAVSLTADPVFLTAWANDIGFVSVFSRQIEAYAREGDVLIGFSTSGASRNLAEAFNKAREMGMRTIAVLGSGGGEVMALADIPIVVPSEDTQRIQEVHELILHVLCELVETQLLEAKRQSPIQDRTTENLILGAPAPSRARTGQPEAHELLAPSLDSDDSIGKAGV
jgi:D-inositol-3-phosphate glycosyltransferase